MNSETAAQSTSQRGTSSSNGKSRYSLTSSATEICFLFCVTIWSTEAFFDPCFWRMFLRFPHAAGLAEKLCRVGSSVPLGLKSYSV